MNFNFPETWTRIAHDGHWFRIVTKSPIQSSDNSDIYAHTLRVCPICSAVVMEADAHRKWHKELEPEL